MLIVSMGPPGKALKKDRSCVEKDGTDWTYLTTMTLKTNTHGDWACSLRCVRKGKDRSIHFPQSIRLGSREGSEPGKSISLIFCIIFKLGVFFRATLAWMKNKNRIQVIHPNKAKYTQRRNSLKKRFQMMKSREMLPKEKHFCQSTEGRIIRKHIF